MKTLHSVLIILGLILGLGFGWYQSSLSAKIAKQDAKEERDKAESVSKLLKEAKDEAERVNILLQNYQVTKQGVQYVTKEVIKEVIRYRDVVVNRCQLDGLWVSTYNLSTLSKAKASTTTRVNGPPSSYGIDQTFDSADILETATFNNRQCVGDKEQLYALQQWVKQL